MSKSAKTGKKFKYRLDKQARVTTWVVAGVIVVVVLLLWLLIPGAYLPAWFASITGAVAGLCALSIPRNVRVTEEALEINCLVEVTHIHYDHLHSVRRVEKSELKPLLPVFASLGFFGYFGYFLDVNNWDFIKVYASSWQGLVVIEDIHEQRYVVSCDDPDALLAAIEAEKAKFSW